MKEVDHLITVSDSIKEIYQKRYPNVPITVIYNTPSYQEELQKDKTYKNSFVIAYEGVVTYQKEILEKSSKLRIFATSQ